MSGSNRASRARLGDRQHRVHDGPGARARGPRQPHRLPLGRPAASGDNALVALNGDDHAAFLVAAVFAVAAALSSAVFLRTAASAPAHESEEAVGNPAAAEHASAMFHVIRQKDLPPSPNGTVEFEGEAHGAGSRSCSSTASPPGPGLHLHSYPETWIVRAGRALVTADEEEIEAFRATSRRRAQFSPLLRNLGPGRLEIICIHAAGRMVTEWLDDSRPPEHQSPRERALAAPISVAHDRREPRPEK